MRLITEICKKHLINARSVNTLSGGDINQVYKITSSKEDFVVKMNEAELFPQMFEIEAKSLQILRNTKSFVIPEVKAHGEYNNKTYLLLEYISSGDNFDFSETFAHTLADLHKTQSDVFGLEFNNYIGRLHQSNQPKVNNSLEFFINLRLEPQFKLAHNKGFEFGNIDNFYKSLESLIPIEKASLIHGDLWSGNYLITKSGKACIFDPAIAFAPREMDLAMMKLFGGYPRDIFEIYDEVFPLENNWKSRMPLWQLYFVLVHVNLFGSSYYQQAKNIVNQFTR
jgi:fructosamine-3-kinase